MKILRKLIFATLFIIPTLLLAGEVININTADKETLMSIKGIGERRAMAIIQYRNEHGPFKSIDQLADIKGIGKVLVDANRNNLSADQNK